MKTIGFPPVWRHRDCHARPSQPIKGRIYPMKIPFTAHAAFVLGLTLASLLFAPVTRAGQSEAQATAILTAGVWRIEYTTKSIPQDRVFYADGTTTADGGFAKSAAKWRIDSLHVTIIYPDHEEVLSLPIDPSGIAGKDGKGMDMSARLLRLNRPRADNAAPTPASDPATDESVKLLTAGKWNFTAADGTVSERTFHPNGMLVITDPRTAGEWMIAGGVLLISLPNRAEMAALPLDPKGTKVQGAGASYIATQIAPEVPPVRTRRPIPAATPDATPAPAAAAAPSPSPLEQPAATPAAQSLNDAMRILEAYVWTVKGHDAQEQLQFFPNGTVTAVSQPDAKPGGADSRISWRIDRIHVTVIFPDREETLYLPIDTKGTKGRDAKGADLVATGDHEVTAP